MTPIRALLCEHDLTLVEKLEEYLVQWGHDVVGRVSAVNEIPRAFREYQADVILVDIDDLEESERQALESIADPYIKAGIIYLGDNSIGASIIDGSPDEPIAFIEKPVSRDELKRGVELAVYKKRMETSLMASKKNLSTILESISEGFFILDRNLVVTYFNSASERLLGRKREEVLGRPLFEAFPEAKGSIFEENYRAAVSQRRTLVFETYFGIAPYANWYEVRVYPFEDGISVYFQVITDRKIAEAALEEEKERLLVTLRSIGDGVISVDTQGRVMSLNKVAEDLTGWGEKEALGRPVGEVFHIINEHTRNPVENPVEKALQSGVVVGLANHTVLVKRDGTEFILADSGAPILAKDGAIIGAVLVFRDVTEEKKAENLLKENEERFRLVMEATNDGIWDWDMASGTVYRNPAFYKMLGFSGPEFPEDFRGWKELIHPEDVDFVMDVLDSYLSGKVSDYEVEFRMLDKSGNIVWILSRGRIGAVDEEGRPIRMVGTHTDITERKIAEGELKLRAVVLDQIKDHVVITDLSGVITYVNQVQREVFGFSSDSLLGKSIEAFGEDPEHYVSQREILENTLSEGSWRGEVLNYDKYGNELIMDCRTLVVRDESGQPICLCGVSTDITESKRAAEALKQSEEKYRTIFESPGLYVSIYDKDGICQMMNSTVAQMFGGKPEDFIGKTMKELHPAMWAEYTDRIREVIESQNPLDVEDLVEFPSGSRWLFSEVRPFELPGTNKKVAQILSFDITDRKMAEESLKDSHRRLDMAQKIASIGTWEWEPQTGQVFWTDELYRIFGFEPGSFPPSYKRVKEIAHPDDLETWVNTMREAIRSKDWFTLTHRVVRKDGEVIWIHNEGQIVRDQNGRAVKIIGTAQDVTRQKMAEENMLNNERITAVGELASGVAHNFNNLLQIVLGCSQLALTDLQLGALGQAQENLLQIVESSKIGAQTVKRLQDYARAKSPIYGGATKVFDLSDVVREAIEMSKPWWKTEPEKNGLFIDMNHSLKEGCVIKGNDSELFEVAVNLIKNAAEALESGGEMRLETTVEGDMVVFTVQDNGIGIDKDHLSKIFDPFWTTKGPKGTGMGLSSCYGIIGRHGGKIKVESEPGALTTFKVIIPMASGVPKAKKQESAQITPISLNILAIDDNPAVIEQIQKGLSSMGQNVFSALSGEEALKVFNDNQLDVIISDLAMPGMNGRQVAGEIKRICLQRGIDKPLFILLTGWGGQIEEDTDIAEYGIDAILEKPVEMGKILQIIEELRS